MGIAQNIALFVECGVGKKPVKIFCKYIFVIFLTVLFLVLPEKDSFRPGHTMSSLFSGPGLQPAPRVYGSTPTKTHFNDQGYSGKVDNTPELTARFRALKALDNGINEKMTKEAIYHIFNLAPDYDLDPDIVLAVGFVESRFTNLIGPTGDFGIMQINYKVWGEELGLAKEDLFDIERSVATACQILSHYRVRWSEHYIGAYNGFGRGYEGRVKQTLFRIREHLQADGISSPS
ncbi:lytic transglycosylase domain-containing protein [bacterium]|nr:MAG: lytic transglycosylase domain-containing protein [bacterium]